MLEYNSEYRVLICPIHKYAVHDADDHLRTSHCITGREKDALLDQWKGLDLVNPEHVNRQPSGKRPKNFLNEPVPGYSCSSCFFLSIKWEAVQYHHETVHGREIALAPLFTGQNPDVQFKKLQTFFPYPHIRWFAVDDKNDDRSDEDRVTRNDVKNEESVVTGLSEDPAARDPADEMLAQAKASENRYRYGSKIREQQRSQAPKLREANASSLYLARLPLEIRQEIYKLVLGSGTVFHIIDESAIVKPDLLYIVGTGEHDEHDEHDEEDDSEGMMELRDDWEDDLEEEIVDTQFEAREKTSFRAVSIPKSTPHALALLRVCSHFNEEATSIFYGSNQFRLHSGISNFSTAIQFLNLLSPATRKCITAFGVTGLQPCMKAGPGRYGIKQRTYEFMRKCRAYYQSEEMFFSNALPQMALKEINVCILPAIFHRIYAVV